MRESGRRPARRKGLGCLAAVALVLSAAGCGPDEGGEPLPGQGPTAERGRDLTGADLWLSFDDDTVVDDGATTFLDAAGGPSVGRVVGAADGDVEVVQGPPDRGSAIALPSRCDAPTGCPRAMVEVDRALSLDPGTRDFEYGATVWLSPDQTTSGSNIVQQGRFGSEGGQWKLQVDDDDGRPSCVVRGATHGAEPLVVRSKVSIADSEWHEVVCRRDGAGLSIEVDGEVTSKAGVTGTVASEEPIRVGAPGVADEDDQFHGRVDDVFLLIGSAG